MNPVFPLARLVEVRRAGFRLRQRGFTLIELAIALTVVGLVLGASIIPLRMLDEARQLRDEQRRMEVVRDAVVGYALRHRTRERTLKIVAWNAPGSMSEFRLPAGRPYLPCPDWDGDGFEDRAPEGPGGFVQGMEVRPPGLTVTGTVFVSPDAGAIWAVFSNRISPYGECQTQRGSVPWRTLGIPPADGWGNRHTYFADVVFSNAMFGFDRQTIADMFDPRMPAAPGHPLARRFPVEGNRTRIISTSPYVIEIAYRHTNICPATVCDGGRTGDDNGQPGDCARHDYSPRAREAGWCVWREALVDGLILKAGAAAGMEIGGERKFFPKGGVTDGLPFVLVSHGPNGRFAVNHWGTLQNPVDEMGAKSPICNVHAWSGPSVVQGRLAVGTDDPADLALAHEAVNGGRDFSGDPFNVNPRCPRVHGLHENQQFSFNESFFVWEPPGIGDKSGFDDLLLWMTREELSLAAPGQIPPLPPMVIAYFP